jgi:hypothetical protein
MLIKRRIRLGDRIFYICCECEYNQKDEYIAPELKNYKDKYYDDGDLSILIEKIEKNYNASTYKKYDSERWLMTDCLYIYDNVPFISGVEDCRVSSVDGSIVSSSYITTDELNEYIKNKNIEMNDKNKFKLWDERTWFLK